MRAIRNKSRITPLIFVIMGLSAQCSGTKECNENFPPIPREIAQYENGITVTHLPDTVYARQDDIQGNYVLAHLTTVTSEIDSLRIFEFGCYIVENGKWVHKSITEEKYGKRKFEKWYDCPDAILISGNKYTDHFNWLRRTTDLNGDCLQGLWYYLGKAPNGKIYSGTKEIIGQVSIRRK